MRIAWKLLLPLYGVCIAVPIACGDGPLFPVVEGGRCGYIDKTGTLVIPVQFQQGKPFSEGLAAVAVSNAWGFIDRSGRITIPCRYEAVDQFSEGMAVVRIEGRFGYIDTNGNMVITTRFSNAYGFRDGIARATIGNEWVYINRHGSLIYPPELGREEHSIRYLADTNAVPRDAIGRMDLKELLPPWSWSENRLPIYIDGKWGFADSAGKIVIAAEYDMVCAFSEGIASVHKNGKSGYIDLSGRIVGGLDFCCALPFRNGLGIVERSGRYVWGGFDKEGRLIMPFKRAEKLGPFSEGLMAISGHKMVGYVDTNWNVVIETHRRWRYALPFQEGLAVVALWGDGFADKYQYIDKSGEVVIPGPFDGAKPFSKDGLAEVTVEDKTGYIDRGGRFVWEPSK